MNADPTAPLLRRVVRALPERQAEWGEAMRAELAGIAGAGRRWGFVLGCAAAVLRRPAGLLTLAGWLIRLAALVSAVAVAWAIGVPRVREEAIGVLVALMLVYGLLRSRVGFGPVADARGVRLVAGCGVLLVVLETMTEFRQLRVVPPLMLPMNATIGVYDLSRATSDLVGMGVALAILLVALAMVTARYSAVTAGTVAIGGGVAARACVGWLAVVLLRPSVSSVGSPAILAVMFAGLVAGVMNRDLGRWPLPTRSAGRPDPSARTDRPRGPELRLIAALLAATGTAFGIGLLMDLLPLTGGWVSNSSPPDFSAHPPTRIVDGVVVWLPGLVLAITLALSVHGRPRARRRNEALAAAR